MGDLLGLVVGMEVARGLGKRGIGPTAQDDAILFGGHGGDERAGLLAQLLARHAGGCGHHHVDHQLAPGTDDTADDTAAAFAEAVRRFVRFAAAHPELNRIMVHEATEDSDRLRWMVDHHARPIYDAIGAVWSRLRVAGIAAPIDPAMVHYVVVGAASLPFVNAPEARLLTGAEPTDPSWVEAHADGLVATLLPGLVDRPRPER